MMKVHSVKPLNEVQEGDIARDQYDEFDEEENSIPLRTIIEFELFDKTTGELVPFEALGPAAAAHRHISLRGILLKPLPDSWRHTITDLLITAPPDNLDSATASGLSPVKASSSTTSGVSEAAPPGHFSQQMTGSASTAVVSITNHVQEAASNNEDKTAAEPVPVVFNWETIKQGDLVDGYCNKTLRWYPAKVLAVEPPGPGARVKVHFLGWNSKYDEWIDRGSERLLPHGTSKAAVRQALKIAHQMVPWYLQASLMRKTQEICSGEPYPRRDPLPVLIDRVDDWCVDYTYANPQLWLIAGDIWYRVAGALNPGGCLGSASELYRPLFMPALQKYLCTAHLAMLLIDHLPVSPTLAFTAACEEAAKRSAGLVNEVVALQEASFIEEQLSSLDLPEEWAARRLTIKDSLFLTQLRREAELFKEGGGMSALSTGQYSGPHPKRRSALHNRHSLAVKELLVTGGVALTEIMESTFFPFSSVGGGEDEGGGGGLKKTSSSNNSNRRPSTGNSLAPVRRRKLELPVPEVMLWEAESLGALHGKPVRSTAVPLPKHSEQLLPFGAKEKDKDLYSRQSQLLTVWMAVNNYRRMLNLPEGLTVRDIEEALSDGDGGAISPLLRDLLSSLLVHVLKDRVDSGLVKTSRPNEGSGTANAAATSKNNNTANTSATARVASAVASTNTAATTAMVVDEEGQTAAEGDEAAAAVRVAVDNSRPQLILEFAKGNPAEILSTLRTGDLWLPVLRLLIEQEILADLPWLPMISSPCRVFDDLAACQRLLEEMCTVFADSVQVFKSPVISDVLGLSDYREIVKHPMDLGTIKQRLVDGWYEPVPTLFTPDTDDDSNGSKDNDDDALDGSGRFCLAYNKFSSVDRYYQVGQLVDYWDNALKRWLEAIVVRRDYQPGFDGCDRDKPVKVIAYHLQRVGLGIGGNQQRTIHIKADDDRITSLRAGSSDRHRKLLPPDELYKRHLIGVPVDLIINEEDDDNNDSRSSSSSTKGKGHAGFAHDIFLVFTNCQRYYAKYPSLDTGSFANEARRMLTWFETNYHRQVLMKTDEAAAILAHAIITAIDNCIPTMGGNFRPIEAWKGALKSFLDQVDGDEELLAQLNGSDAAIIGSNLELLSLAMDPSKRSFLDLSPVDRLELLHWLTMQFIGLPAAHAELNARLTAVQREKDRADKAAEKQALLVLGGGSSAVVSNGESSSLTLSLPSVPAINANNKIEPPPLPPMVEGKGTGRAKKRKEMDSDMLDGAAADQAIKAAYSNNQQHATTTAATAMTMPKAKRGRKDNLEAYDKDRAALHALYLPNKAILDPYTVSLFPQQQQQQSCSSSSIDNSNNSVENMMYRIEPIGVDRFNNRYWLLPGRLSLSDRPTIIVELRSSQSIATADYVVHQPTAPRWLLYSHPQDILQLVQWLDERGANEACLMKIIHDYLRYWQVILPVATAASTHHHHDSNNSNEAADDGHSSSGNNKPFFIPLGQSLIRSAEQVAYEIVSKWRRQSFALLLPSPLPGATAAAVASGSMMTAAASNEIQEAASSSNWPRLEDNKEAVRLRITRFLSDNSSSSNEELFLVFIVQFTPSQRTLGMGVKSCPATPAASAISAITYVTTMAEGGISKAAGLRVGDAIIMAGDRYLPSVSELVAMVKSTAASIDDNSNDNNNSSRRAFLKLMIRRRQKPELDSSFAKIMARDSDVSTNLNLQATNDETVLTAAVDRWISLEQKGDYVPKKERFKPPFAELSLQYNRCFSEILSLCMTLAHPAAASITWRKSLFPQQLSCIASAMVDPDCDLNSLLCYYGRLLISLEHDLFSQGHLLQSEWIDSSSRRRYLWRQSLSFSHQLLTIETIVMASFILRTQAVDWDLFRSHTEPIEPERVPTVLKQRGVDQDSFAHLLSVTAGRRLLYYSDGHRQAIEADRYNCLSSSLQHANYFHQLTDTYLRGRSRFNGRNGVCWGEDRPVVSGYVAIVCVQSVRVYDGNIPFVQVTLALQAALPGNNHAFPLPHPPLRSSCIKLSINRRLMRILTVLKKINYIKPFLQAVDEVDFPSYREIITKPIDLSMIEKKINQNLYSGPRAFIIDLELLHNNCILFCGPDNKKLPPLTEGLLRDAQLLCAEFFGQDKAQGGYHLKDEVLRQLLAEELALDGHDGSANKSEEIERNHDNDDGMEVDDDAIIPPPAADDNIDEDDKEDDDEMDVVEEEGDDLSPITPTAGDHDTSDNDEEEEDVHNEKEDESSDINGGGGSPRREKNSNIASDATDTIAAATASSINTATTRTTRGGGRPRVMTDEIMTMRKPRGSGKANSNNNNPARRGRRGRPPNAARQLELAQLAAEQAAAAQQQAASSSQQSTQQQQSNTTVTAPQQQLFTVSMRLDRAWPMYLVDLDHYLKSAKGWHATGVTIDSTTVTAELQKDRNGTQRYAKGVVVGTRVDPIPLATALPGAAVGNDGEIKLTAKVMPWEFVKVDWTEPNDVILPQFVNVWDVDLSQSS